MKTFTERLAEALATVFLISALLYFVGHIVAAWLRGAFQAVSR
jgi:hypothetical protein